MKYLLGLLALLSAAVAVAIPASRLDDGFPPLRFQSDAVVLVHFVSRPLPAVCGEIPKGYRLNGCVPVVGVHEAYLPNPCASEFAGQSFARYACHEMGHVNGWSADHPRP